MRKLRNTCLIEGEHGALEIELWDPNGRIYFKQGDDLVLHGGVGPSGGQDRASAQDIFQRQLADFVAAIRHGGAPFVSGQEGLRAVRLIENCYASKQLLELPWMTSRPAQHGYRRVA
jgi:predicted dehydrogenase